MTETLKCELDTRWTPPTPEAARQRLVGHVSALAFVGRRDRSRVPVQLGGAARSLSAGGPLARLVVAAARRLRRRGAAALANQVLGAPLI